VEADEGFTVAICVNAMPNAVIEPGFCPTVWARGLMGSRSLEVAANGDLLTVESQANRVTVLWDEDGNK
jgi:hypothetical protein